MCGGQIAWGANYWSKIGNIDKNNNKKVKTPYKIDIRIIDLKENSVIEDTKSVTFYIKQELFSIGVTGVVVHFQYFLIIKMQNANNEKKKTCGQMDRYKYFVSSKNTIKSSNKSTNLNQLGKNVQTKKHK